MKETRTLKVGYLYNSKDQKVPIIKISGKWLTECNFNIDSAIEIKCQKNKLIIEKITS